MKYLLILCLTLSIYYTSTSQKNIKIVDLLGKRYTLTSVLDSNDLIILKTNKCCINCYTDFEDCHKIKEKRIAVLIHSPNDVFSKKYLQNEILKKLPKNNYVFYFFENCKKFQNAKSPAIIIKKYKKIIYYSYEQLYENKNTFCNKVN